jgi:hypothetical protein
MFEVYDAREEWVASFVTEADALLFVAAKARKASPLAEPSLTMGPRPTPPSTPEPTSKREED